MIERQDLHCTNCGRHVIFDMDFGLDGNHEITCPECKHVHYRVVRNGKITEDRWNSSMPTYIVSSATTTTTATFYIGSTAASGTDLYFLGDAWLQTA